MKLRFLLTLKQYTALCSLRLSMIKLLKLLANQLSPLLNLGHLPHLGKQYIHVCLFTAMRTRSVKIAPVYADHKMLLVLVVSWDGSKHKPVSIVLVNIMECKALNIVVLWF